MKTAIIFALAAAIVAATLAAPAEERNNLAAPYRTFGIRVEPKYYGLGGEEQDEAAQRRQVEKSLAIPDFKIAVPTAHKGTVRTRTDGQRFRTNKAAVETQVVSEPVPVERKTKGTERKTPAIAAAAPVSSQ